MQKAKAEIRKAKVAESNDSGRQSLSEAEESEQLKVKFVILRRGYRKQDSEERRKQNAKSEGLKRQSGKRKAKEQSGQSSSYYVALEAVMAQSRSQFCEAEKYFAKNTAQCNGMDVK